MDVLELGNILQRTYPTRNWNNQCERVCWNGVYFAAGQPKPEFRGYDTANEARAASTVTRHSLAELQPGDTGWSQYPGDGHDWLYVGNGLALMASTHGTRVHDFGRGLVVIEAASYPSEFLGGTHKHGVWPEVTITSDSLVSHPAPPQTVPASSGHVVLPTRSQWLVIQGGLKKRHRYSGPIDGVPGINTWKGVQLTARAGGGYSGPIDGVPGHNTWVAVQTYAKHWGGYLGPIDGVPGFNTWQGFANGVK